MARHHHQVTYITFRMADLLAYSEKERIQLSLAAFLHDIGALSLEEHLDQLSFENSGIHNHAELGSLFLQTFAPFQYLAPIVRYHHFAWAEGKTRLRPSGDAIPSGSYIFHLADRAAVLIKNENILSQKDDICKHLLQQKGSVFMPEHLDAFMELAGQDYLEIRSFSQLPFQQWCGQCQRRLFLPQVNPVDHLQWQQ
jgi:response regulator RpfG family c-di-GMP phosphodiesterase